jgi:hypothetical protein
MSVSDEHASSRGGEHRRRVVTPVPVLGRVEVGTYIAHLALPQGAAFNRQTIHLDSRQRYEAPVTTSAASGRIARAHLTVRLVERQDKGQEVSLRDAERRLASLFPDVVEIR